MSSAVATVGRGIKRLVLVVAAIAVLIGLYYAVGGHLVHTIDADRALGEDVVAPEGGSRTVATMAALVRREVDQHGWVANDPAVFPSHFLDDMAHYQQALLASTRAMTDRLAALTDTPAVLNDAAEALAAPGDLWTFDLSAGVSPQRASESYYREAADDLTRFNGELAAGTATLPLDASATATIVRSFADTLAAAAEAGLAQVDARGGHWLDTTTDDRFQTTRGLVYARLLFLAALGEDAPEAFAVAGDAAATARGRLERAAGLGPWYVMNGEADGQWRPSHLAAQAAYVLEASAALRSLAAQLDAGDT